MFDKKVVLITGGSSGIGMAAAFLFAEKDADIIITYKNNQEGAEAVVEKIKNMGKKVLAIKADLTNDEDAKNIVDKTLDAFQKIDILVNNAGRYIDGDEWNLESATWIKSLDQNLISVMRMSKYVMEIFQKQKSGIIINIASRHAVSGEPDAISYGAAKAGVINVTQSYSKLLSEFGGRANAISPSAVNTGYWLTAPKEELEKRLAINPLIEPKEITEKIIFLASDEAKNINGQNFIIE
jgi:3-oxoacyl-[acyl-carrier protein] reductase